VLFVRDEAEPAIEVIASVAPTEFGLADTEIWVHENNEPSAFVAASVDIHQETVVAAPLATTRAFKVALVVATLEAGLVVADGGPAAIVTV
jgi:hypothetical protein